MMRFFRVLAVLVMGLSSFVQEGAAQLLAEKPALTLEAAKIIAAAAEAEARQHGWEVVIAITDEGGHLLFLQRMDGVQRGSLEIAQRKARTAALYRRPSKAFADRLAGGNVSTLAFPDVIPLEGGVPIVVEGHTLGAVGVSGVQAAQDAQIARAGIDALLARLEE